ncbi:MAG: hypothetical protein ABIK09_14525 [Pseudomonadota bacterium]
MQHWDLMDVPPGQTRRVAIGPLCLWIRRMEHEWRLAWAGNESPGARRDDAAAGDEPPPHAEWSRWAAPAGETRLQLIPVLPDRGVVVRPTGSFRIPPGVKVRLFVPLPVWVRVATGSATVLTEVPTTHLSNTWFGEPDAGELSWAVKADPRFTFEDHAPAGHEALCRVDIHHKGGEQIELNRLFVRVEHLRVYRAGAHLWTNGIKAVYEGGEKVGSVDYLKSAPSQAAGAVKLSDEREPVGGALVRARAGLLRSLEVDKRWWGGTG